MSFKRKFKIASAQDIITILSIVIVLTISLTNVLGNNETIEVKTNGVSTRNLAMFASIAYADLEKVGYKVDTNINKIKFKEQNMVSDDKLRSMYTSTELFGTKLDVKLDMAENTYDYLFYGLASTSEVKDWKIVNYSKIKTTLSSKHALFTAATFKKGNDIVIAYRGTDFDDIGDWLQDIVGYGIIGRTGQEGATEKYAKAVAEQYKDANIYITGHSLGGFLAQIGGNTLIEKQKNDPKLKFNIKSIEYFNGIGLKFISNLEKTLNNKNINKLIDNMSKITSVNKELKYLPSKINEIETNALKLSEDKTFETFQDKVMYNLKEYYNQGGILISHHINGDLVSALGEHCGESKGYDAYEACINHHNGNKTNMLAIEKACQKGTKNLLKAIKPIAFNNDISEYVSKYNVTNVIDFAWIVHETDSFFGVLETPTMEIEFTKVPATIKYRKTATIELTIKTNVKILEPTLEKNDFTVSNKGRLSIISVNNKKDNGKYEDGRYIYKYEIKIKGGSLIGNSTISINPGAIKAEENTCVLNNVRVFSRRIRTKIL